MYIGLPDIFRLPQVCVCGPMAAVTVSCSIHSQRTVAGDKHKGQSGGEGFEDGGSHLDTVVENYSICALQLISGAPATHAQHMSARAVEAGLV